MFTVGQAEKDLVTNIKASIRGVHLTCQFIKLKKEIGVTGDIFQDVSTFTFYHLRKYVRLVQAISNEL